MLSTENLKYVGFWPRLGATLVDVLLEMCIVIPLVYIIYGEYDFVEYAGPAHVFIELALPAIITIALWVRLGTTPGKMAVSAKIVNADTGELLRWGPSIVRYLGYFISIIPLGMGLFWIAFDARKQGWHDKLANSVVVSTKTTALHSAATHDP